jgi:prepilin peptidase CpaA
MEPKYLAVLIVALIACVTDIRSRRIPNILTFGAASAGLLFHSFAPAGEGVTTAAFGWLIGVVAFFIPFALGGLGGGDVKLLGALGAWLGPVPTIWVVLYSGVAGGVMAIVVALARGYARQAASNVYLLLAHWRVAGISALPELTLDTSAGPRLAYAVPIFAGTAVAIWLR